MIPLTYSSYSPSTPLLSLSESIDSLYEMVKQTPLSYQKESCRRLFRIICQQAPQTIPCQAALKTLESMIHYSVDVPPVHLKKILQELKNSTT